jgi:CheY-like chemotaxis protein/LmbE family N-acetylglucosaminyl deacetylase
VPKTSEEALLTADSGAPLRVLFVEDAFDHALLVKAFLSAAGGYEVTHTQDGDQAIRLIQDREWDLVITDLNLPGTDGFEVIRVARAKSPDLPILAITGYTEQTYHDQATSASAGKVLTKPLDKDLFLEVLKSVLGAEVEPSPAAGNILAVEGLAGDVEMGCGGTLLQAAAAGHTVVVLPLSQDELDAGDAALKASKAACRVLGLRLVVDKAALEDAQRRVAVMRKAVADLQPVVVYVPSMDDSHPARMDAFRVAKAATGDVPTVLAYQTATTRIAYHPTHFVDVGDHMDTKLAALSHFEPAYAGRPDLRPEMARAYAHYWGRHLRFSQVEAFEVIQGSV